MTDVADDRREGELLGEMPPEDPPELDYILRLAEERKAFYAQDDIQIDDMRSAVNGTFSVSVPDEAMFAEDVVYRDSTIRDEAARIPSMFYNNEPRLKITPISETDANQQLATRVERFTVAALQEAGKREIGDTTAERIIKCTCNDGGGWSKLVFNNSYWRDRYNLKIEDFQDDPMDFMTGKPGKTAAEKYQDDVEDAKKAGGIPVDWISVDARTIYPVFYGRALGEMLEIQQRPVNEVFRRYRLGYSRDNKIVDAEYGAPNWASRQSAGMSVEFIIHYTDTWCSEVVHGGPGGSRIVRQWKHGLPGIPYFSSISLAQGHERNRKIGMSISETKLGLVKYLSFLRTLHAQQAIRDTVPPLIEESPIEAGPLIGNDGRPQTLQTMLGAVHHTAPGARLSVLQLPQTLDKLQREIELVRADIERLEAPKLSGESGNLQGAGFAMSSFLTERNVRFTPIGTAIERHFTEVTKFLWKMIVTKIRETMYVNISADGKTSWVSVTPRDVSKPMKVEWELNPEAPSAKVVEERYWASRVQNGSASEDMMTEALGSNPDQVRFGRALDRIRKSPAYQAQEEASVWAEIGRGDRAQLQQYAEAIAQLMQQAQTGTPPEEAAAPADPTMQGISGGPGQGMAGNTGVPDFAALASSPNGTGTAPVAGPGPGAMGGMPVTPSGSALAASQDLGS